MKPKRLEISEPAWRAPFDGHVITDMACPVCEAEEVCVRVDSSEDPRPAYSGPPIDHDGMTFHLCPEHARDGTHGLR